jgi:hypothetical protein
MKQDLDFFTKRIGFKVHRSSEVMTNEAIMITDEKHAKGLFASQQDGCVYSISAKLRIIGVHTDLLFDGKKLRCNNGQPEALKKIEELSLILENPLEFAETYRDTYAQIIERRKAAFNK